MLTLVVLGEKSHGMFFSSLAVTALILLAWVDLLQGIEGCCGGIAYLWFWLHFQCPVVPGLVLARAPSTLSTGNTTQREPEGYKALVEEDPTVPV